MQKSTIVILSIVFIAIIWMITSLMESGNYATFADAAEQEGKNVTIIGELNKNKKIVYDAAVNANRTEFYVVDKSGAEKKVIFHDAKPRDIEKSEEITMEGRMIKGEFHAVHILLKCPSKYTPNEIGVKDTLQTSFSAEIPELQ